MIIYGYHDLGLKLRATLQERSLLFVPSFYICRGSLAKEEEKYTCFKHVVSL